MFGRLINRFIARVDRDLRFHEQILELQLRNARLKIMLKELKRYIVETSHDIAGEKFPNPGQCRLINKIEDMIKEN